MAGSTTNTRSFLFTDIVGSMRLWELDSDAMERALEAHDAVIAEVTDQHGGQVFSVGGDGFGIVFEAAPDALDAAALMQRRLVAEAWPGGLDLTVRMGLHCGQAQARDGSWFGQDVNVAARVCGAANGGQVLVTQEVADRVPTADLLGLGLFELRGVVDKLALHQLGLHLSFPSPRAIDPSRDTLPEPANALIGRGDEVGAVRSMVVANRMVTLTGVGGMGKTRLAIEVAHRMAPTFSDGVYFADLTPVSSSEAIVAQIAAAVRLELLSGDLREQAVEQVAQRSALLILDNCEHVRADVAAFVAEVLGRGGPGRVLATSRERLGVSGEHQFRLGALSAESGEGLSDRARLFVDRALAVDPAFEVGDVDVLDELLERLDGLPLAIELAAARTSILSVEEIGARLDDRLALLRPGRSGAGRTLEAMLDWSWQLLDEPERAALATASLFEEGFDVDLLAGSMGGDVYEALDLADSLVDKSLFAVEGRVGGRTRFHLLESVRVYAAARLDEMADRGERERAVGDALFERFRSLGEPHVSSPPAPNQDLAADLSSALVAIERLRSHDDDESADFANHVSAVLLSVGRASEATSLLSHVASDEQLSDARRGRATIGLGIAAVQMDDFGSAIELARQLTDDDEPFLRACAAGLQAVPGLFNGDEETDRLVEASLAAAREADNMGVFPYLIDGFRRFAQLDMAGAAEAMSPGRSAAAQPRAVLQTMLCCGHALALILDGRYDEAREGLDQLIPGDSVWDASEMLRAVIDARTGALDDAERRLLVVGDDALLGRLSRQANDVMIGFAVLSAAEGDLVHARKLLAESLLPRNVYAFALAAHLAGEIDDLEAMVERSQRLRREQGSSRAEASDALAAELARRRMA